MSTFSAAQAEYLATINRLIASLQEAIAEAGYGSFVNMDALKAAEVAALRNVAFLATTYVTKDNWSAWSESAESTVASLTGALRLAGKYSYDGVGTMVAQNLGAVAVNAAESAGEAVVKGAAVGAGALVLLVGLVILLKVA